jgi:hypothetical protein
VKATKLRKFIPYARNRGSVVTQDDRRGRVTGVGFLCNDRMSIILGVFLFCFIHTVFTLIRV